MPLPRLSSLLRSPRWVAQHNRRTHSTLLRQPCCCLLRCVASRAAAQQGAAAITPRARALHATAAMGSANGSSGGHGTSPDHFTRLGYAATGAGGGYVIDAEELKRRYQALQREHHPDALAAAGRGGADDALEAAAESAQINLSYATLLDPLKRAEYMLELHGAGIHEGDGAEDTALLMEVMEWREDIEYAQEEGDPEVLAGLVERFRAERAEAEGRVASAWAGGDGGSSAVQRAKRATVRLKYVTRAVEELEGLLPAA
jgi:molecular chaperone HscB